MNFFKKASFLAVFCMFLLVPSFAYAEGFGGIIDAFNFNVFVPIVLEALMGIATSMYNVFVDSGTIYILIWGFLGFTTVLYLVKLYLPKKWTDFLSFGGGDSLWNQDIGGMKIAENVLKPGFRAIIATVVLLQLKPVFLTHWLINPFLEFGSIYTEQIVKTINQPGATAESVTCPDSIIEDGWLTKNSCTFMMQPIANLSKVNNSMIKKGFEFTKRGLRGMLTLIPHGGEDIMNFLTGIILIFTFFGSNIFMALLVIQGIFAFGVQLILYPFYVLGYVTRPNDKWLDIWPAFSGITQALQKLIITMIACAFILVINIAIIKALFNWNSSVFVTAAGGTSVSNVPHPASSAMGFGAQSITIISAILTFYLMFKIFEMTKQQLQKYAGEGTDAMYNKVMSDTNNMRQMYKAGKTRVKDITGWFKK